MCSDSSLVEKAVKSSTTNILINIVISHNAPCRTRLPCRFRVVIAIVTCPGVSFSDPAICLWPTVTDRAAVGDSLSVTRCRWRHGPESRLLERQTPAAGDSLSVTRCWEETRAGEPYAGASDTGGG